MDKLWYGLKMEYYSAIKRNEPEMAYHHGGLRRPSFSPPTRKTNNTKIDKYLATLTKKRRLKIRNERDITTDTSEQKGS